MRIIPIQGLNALAWTMTVANILLTAGRFVIRWRKTHRIRWDDHLNAVALLFMIGFIITYQLYVPIEYNAELYAMGLSDKAPTEQDVVRDVKIQIANMLLFWVVIYTVKASFLALYWEIFRVSTGFPIWWGVTSAFVGISFLVTWMGVFCHCGAPQNFINLEACAARPRSLILAILSVWCALNVIGDLLLIIMPIALMKPLLMPLSDKIGLGFVFGLVAIEIAFDLTRTVYTASMELSSFPDQNAVWAILEPTIAVMICALPCYRGLISREKSASSQEVDSYELTKEARTDVYSGANSSRTRSVRTDADEEYSHHTYTRHGY